MTTAWDTIRWFTLTLRRNVASGPLGQSGVPSVGRQGRSLLYTFTLRDGMVEESTGAFPAELAPPPLVSPPG
ncbi:hypothetical protein [Streptomyces phaeochromogenes]|uniref:hypothetical protein n=1 Tax=Streptomyces phaeochromogenes TaxID=1923 RepID=UPI0034073B8A